MPLLDAMKLLLQHVIADSTQVSHVILKESDASAKLKKLTLSELTGDILVVDTDKGRIVKSNCKRKVVKTFEGFSPLFCISDTHAHNRSCDYVVIRLMTDSKLEIYYIDLKSDKPSGFSKQFISTRCFMHYVCHVLRDIYNESDLTIARERFVIFHTDPTGGKFSMPKQTTIFNPDNPESGKNTPRNPQRHIVHDGATIRCAEMFRYS
jgi:hypothetical protein